MCFLSASWAISWHYRRIWLCMSSPAAYRLSIAGYGSGTVPKAQSGDCRLLCFDIRRQKSFHCSTAARLQPDLLNGTVFATSFKSYWSMTDGMRATSFHAVRWCCENLSVNDAMTASLVRISEITVQWTWIHSTCQGMEHYSVHHKWCRYPYLATP